MADVRREIRAATAALDKATAALQRVHRNQEVANEQMGIAIRYLLAAVEEASER